MPTNSAIMLEYSTPDGRRRKLAAAVRFDNQKPTWEEMQKAIDDCVCWLKEKHAGDPAVYEFIVADSSSEATPRTP